MTLTDEQRAKCDKLITPEIVDLVRGVTWGIIKRWRIHHRLHDDLFSAANLSLIKSAVQFKPDGNSDNHFEGFAMLHAKWDVIDELRNQIGRIVEGANQGFLHEIKNPLSIDWIYENNDGEELDFFHLTFEEAEYDRIANRDFIWSMCIDEREVLICILYILGLSMREIGEGVVGVTEGRVCQILGRMGEWARYTENV